MALPHCLPGGGDGGTPMHSNLGTFDAQQSRQLSFCNSILQKELPNFETQRDSGTIARPVLSRTDTV